MDERREWGLVWVSDYLINLERLEFYWEARAGRRERLEV